MPVNRVFYRDLIEHDHVYTDCGEDEVGLKMRSAFQTNVCPICLSPLRSYRHTPLDQTPPDVSGLYIIFFPVIAVCKICGWWQSKQLGLLQGAKAEQNLNGQFSEYAYSYHPVIESIDISSNAIAMEDLRRHLTKDWNDRIYISAGSAELLVQSLLQEHLKCDVICTTANVNKADGGIDLYVCHENGDVKAAVQVKRRINKSVESVTEVRNFVGAMVMENINKGIFVTTADRFSSVAIEAPKKINSRLELDLMDGGDLFEILKCFTPPKDIIIPPYVDERMMWHDSDGNVFSLSEVMNLTI